MNLIKKLSICIFLFLASINAQSNESLLSGAINDFKGGEYAKAYSTLKEFSALSDKGSLAAEIADYYKAECLLAQNITDGALAEFEYFINTYPVSSYRPSALYKAGIIYFRNQNFSKSIEKFMALTNHHPGNEYTGYGYYWIGEAFGELNRNYEAEQYLLKSVEENKNNDLADYTLFALSKVYERMGKFDQAIEYYDKLLSNYWDSELAPLAKLRIGICYFGKQDYNNTILELTDPLIEKLPVKEKFQADYLLANSHFKLREYTDAKNLFTDVLKEEFSTEYKDKIDYGLAWINFQMEEYDMAFKKFSKLSSSTNDTLAAVSLYWSGECKRYSGDTDAATAILINYIDKYPRHYLTSTASYNLGLIFYEKGDYKSAEQYFLSVLRETDKNLNAKAYTMMGNISLGNAGYSDAEEYFRRAVELSYSDKDLLNQSSFGLGVTLYYLGNYKESLNILNNINSRNHLFEKNKVNFYLAEAYFQDGNYSAALRHYLRVSADEKSDMAKYSLYGKSYAYYNLKDFSNAAYYFNEYLKLFKDDKNYTDVKLRLADSYYGLKDFERASQIYNSLFNKERRNVDDPNVYYQYGQALFKSGEFSRAIQEFSSLQRRFPRSRLNDDSQFIIGWIYFRQDRFDDAIDSYNRLLELYPASPLRPITYYSIGDALYNQGKFEEAIESYTKIINEYAQTEYVFDAINGIQYCYIALDTPEKAVELIDRFVDSNPSYQYGDQILFKKGEIYFSLGEYQKSQNGYKDFISTYPRSSLVPNAYYWIGKCEQISGNIDEALTNFNYVVDNHLTSEYGVSSVLEIAQIKSDRGDLGEVIDLLKDTEEKLPNSPRLAELIYNKGLAEVHAEKFQDAYRTFTEITQYYTESIFTEKSKIELGKLELSNDRYESAEILFREAGSDRTDDIGAEAQYYYGLALMKQNKIDDAVTVFVRVKSVFAGYDEWYTKALIGLGDCYVTLGDKKEAREMYRAVLRRHNNDEYSTIVKEKMNAL